MSGKKCWIIGEDCFDAELNEPQVADEKVIEGVYFTLAELNERERKQRINVLDQAIEQLIEFQARAKRMNLGNQPIAMIAECVHEVRTLKEKTDGEAGK